MTFPFILFLCGGRDLEAVSWAEICPVAASTLAKSVIGGHGFGSEAGGSAGKLETPLDRYTGHAIVL
jgi:hypothetical protein